MNQDQVGQPWRPGNTGERSEPLARSEAKWQAINRLHERALRIEEQARESRKAAEEGEKLAMARAARLRRFAAWLGGGDLEPGDCEVIVSAALLDAAKAVTPRHVYPGAYRGPTLRQTPHGTRDVRCATEGCDEVENFHGLPLDLSGSADPR